jgi:hypothetical protein
MIDATKKKRLYVATSWRNPYQPEIVRIAREAGFDVYDFREPSPGIHGFSWKEIETKPIQDWTYERYRQVLAHPIAEEAFQRDMAGLQADATLLVLPAGRSAHWEHGYACAKRQRTAALYPVDVALTAIAGHAVGGGECWPCWPGSREAPECQRPGPCRLRTKLRDDFEPELMVKGGSDGIIIGRAELDRWLESVLADGPVGWCG